MVMCGNVPQITVSNILIKISGLCNANTNITFSQLDENELLTILFKNLAASAILAAYLQLCPDGFTIGYNVVINNRFICSRVVTSNSRLEEMCEELTDYIRTLNPLSRHDISLEVFGVLKHNSEIVPFEARIEHKDREFKAIMGPALRLFSIMDHSLYVCRIPYIVYLPIPCHILGATDNSFMLQSQDRHLDTWIKTLKSENPDIADFLSRLKGRIKRDAKIGRSGSIYKYEVSPDICTYITFALLRDAIIDAFITLHVYNHATQYPLIDSLRESLTINVKLLDERDNKFDVDHLTPLGKKLVAYYCSMC